VGNAIVLVMYRRLILVPSTRARRDTSRRDGTVGSARFSTIQMVVLTIEGSVEGEHINTVNAYMGSGNNEQK